MISKAISVDCTQPGECQDSEIPSLTFLRVKLAGKKSMEKDCSLEPPIKIELCQYFDL